MTRVTESFASGPEAKGIYPSPNIACYLRYPCAYCERKFFMVSPITFLAGGGIMHEKICYMKDNTIVETGRSHFMCLSCIQHNKFRERNSGFLI